MGVVGTAQNDGLRPVQYMLGDAIVFQLCETQGLSISREIV
jgi:hypothetical protein